MQEVLSKNKPKRLTKLAVIEEACLPCFYHLKQHLGLVKTIIPKKCMLFGSLCMPLHLQ